MLSLQAQILKSDIQQFKKSCFKDLKFLKEYSWNFIKQHTLKSILFTRTRLSIRKRYTHSEI